MISINRSESPTVLTRATWKGTHYNKKTVVKKLWEMQHEKCCYCEMPIPAKGHSKAVEHFKPKSVFKGLKNDWENLLLACALCNGKKSDKFPVLLTTDSSEPKVVYIKRKSNGTPLIIDPSSEKSKLAPELHIEFVIDDKDGMHGVIKEKSDSKFGRLTINVIGLNESFYTKERQAHYEEVVYPAYLNMLRAKRSNDTNLLDVSITSFKILMSATNKFSAFVREFAKDKKIDENFGVRILFGAETH